MAKKSKKTFTVHVKADVLFESTIEADTLKEALEKAESMPYDTLYSAPGELMDVTHKVTAVFE